MDYPDIGQLDPLRGQQPVELECHKSLGGLAGKDSSNFHCFQMRIQHLGTKEVRN